MRGPACAKGSWLGLRGAVEWESTPPGLECASSWFASLTWISVGPPWPQGVLGALGRKRGNSFRGQGGSGQGTRWKGTAGPSHPAHGGQGDSVPISLVWESRTDPGSGTTL